MSILNKFKKDKKDEAKKQDAAVVDAPKTDTKKKATSAKADAKKKSLQYAHDVLLSPVVSEKTAHMHEFNQYVFKVNVNSNKVSVKKAVMELYKAEPISVKIINVSGKRVVRGRIVGKTAAYKKAIVKMPKGVDLPVYENV